MDETRNSIKNLEIQLEQISRQIMEESQGSFTSNIAISPVEQCEELQSEEGDSEFIEENIFPQALEEEEEESPKEVSIDNLEMESYNSKGDQEEKLVECEEVRSE